MYCSYMTGSWKFLILPSRRFTGLSMPFSKTSGKTAAILETEKLNLRESQLYFHLLGNFIWIATSQKQKKIFKMASTLAKSEAGRRAIQNKIDSL